MTVLWALIGFAIVAVGLWMLRNYWESQGY